MTIFHVVALPSASSSIAAVATDSEASCRADLVSRLNNVDDDVSIRSSSSLDCNAAAIESFTSVAMPAAHCVDRSPASGIAISRSNTPQIDAGSKSL